MGAPFCARRINGREGLGARLLIDHESHAPRMIFNDIEGRGTGPVQFPVHRKPSRLPPLSPWKPIYNGWNMPLTAGDQLGNYQILSRIGAGGMGEVYKARDVRLDRTVAVKYIQGQFSERFDREARAISAL